MKKFLVAAALASLVSTGVGLAASQAAPGPGHGNNKAGLCTAYFNGQKTGWSKEGHSTPPPFQSLEDQANAQDGAGSDTTQNVYNYCDGASGAVGGQPSHGRYPGCFDGDQDGNGNPCDDTA